VQNLSLLNLSKLVVKGIGGRGGGQSVQVQHDQNTNVTEKPLSLKSPFGELSLKSPFGELSIKILLIPVFILGASNSSIILQLVFLKERLNLNKRFRYTEAISCWSQ
jgi:hypothetical protein